MTNEIRLVQFFDLTDADGVSYLYQNYFIEGKQKGNKMFDFAPFQTQGHVSSLGGDNSQLTVLFPTTDYAIRLVELGKGNRKTQLKLTTKTFNTAGTVAGQALSEEFYIGIGASFSESTIELRFNTARDAVGSSFPAQRLSEDNVGILPLDSALSLR